MDSQKECMSLSKRLAELTSSCDQGNGLEKLLEQMVKVIDCLPGISVRSQGAVLLRNPSGLLIQIDQYGLPEEGDLQVDVVDELDLEVRPQAYVTSLSAELSEQWEGEELSLLVLPLLIDSANSGLLLFFAEPGWVPEGDMLTFLTDISRIASSVVARYSQKELLNIREIELKKAHADTIYHLGTASEYRDNETGMHVMRTTHFAMVISKHMGLPPEVREELAIATPMHDVGKIGIRDAILLKPGRLTKEEFEEMKEHASIGANLLEGDDRLIQLARSVALTHHEHWDGNGYPQGLSGEEIPLFGRICTIADVFDALLSSRPYKEPWTLERALQWIDGQSGKKFDPKVVAAFQKALPEILRIRELYRDEVIDPNQTLYLPELPESEGDQWISWQESLSVGIDVIDEHHRYLIHIINDLHDIVVQRRGAHEVAGVLTMLDQYAQIHFAAEEKMMAFYGYAESEGHQQLHNHFRKKVKEFYEGLHNSPLTCKHDMLTYLRDWLIRHIAVEDKKLQVLVTQS